MTQLKKNRIALGENLDSQTKYRNRYGVKFNLCLKKKMQNAAILITQNVIKKIIIMHPRIYSG